MAGSRVQIQIGADVDPSLTASTAQVAQQLDAIAASATMAQATFAAFGAGASLAAQTVVAANAQASASAQQLTSDLKNEDAKRLASWRATDNEILGAESSLVSDIFTKRQGLARDLSQIGYRMAEREVTSDVRGLTEQGLSNIGLFGGSKAADDGGLLMRGAQWLFGGGAAPAPAAQATTGAATGAASQTAEIAALNLNTQAITALNATLAGHGAIVTGNTAATAAGTTATTTDAAATTVSASATSVNAAATSTNAAATSAHSATMLAHMAAVIENSVATAANTVATWASDVGDFLGFASGADNVPNDMVAQIHKGEMIIPAGPAAAIRAGFNMPAIGGSTYASHASSSVVHNWNYTNANTFHTRADALDELRSNPAEFMSFVQGLARGGRLRLS